MAGRISIIIFCCFLAVPAVSATDGSGERWVLATGDAAFQERGHFSAAVFHDKIWVIGGITLEGKNQKYLNDVWYSGDGITWTRATTTAGFSPRYAHTTVVFDDKLWVIGGYDGSFRNDVWYSGDGITWTQATGSARFLPRCSHTSVVFEGRMWVIGGQTTEHPWIYTNDVWHSSDGVAWARTTDSAEFLPRCGHTSVVLNNEIWVTGGVSDAYGNVNYNDVWHSMNGITWSRATGSAAFSPRYFFSSVVFDNLIWVIGGSTKEDLTNDDVWYTADGESWTRVAGSARFSPRYAQATLAFRDRIWVIGGHDGSYANDVWYSEKAPESPGSQTGPVLTKTVSPSSVKQGKNATITIVLTNSGPGAIYDIEITDPGKSDFIISEGSNLSKRTFLGPNQAYTLTYSVQFRKTGKFSLGTALLMYAGEDGNYHKQYSNTPEIEILAPLIPEEQPAFPGVDPVVIVLCSMVMCLVIILLYTTGKKG